MHVENGRYFYFVFFPLKNDIFHNQTNIKPKVNLRDFIGDLIYYFFNYSALLLTLKELKMSVEERHFSRYTTIHVVHI